MKSTLDENFNHNCVNFNFFRHKCGECGYRGSIAPKKKFPSKKFPETLLAKNCHSIPSTFCHFKLAQNYAKISQIYSPNAQIICRLANAVCTKKVSHSVRTKKPRKYVGEMDPGRVRYDNVTFLQVMFMRLLHCGKKVTRLSRSYKTFFLRFPIFAV